jgi:hypothetical protein
MHTMREFGLHSLPLGETMRPLQMALAANMKEKPLQSGNCDNSGKTAGFPPRQ